jgi:hypothetical protein
VACTYNNAIDGMSFEYLTCGSVEDALCFEYVTLATHEGCSFLTHNDQIRRREERHPTPRPECASGELLVCSRYWQYYAHRTRHEAGGWPDPSNPQAAQAPHPPAAARCSSRALICWRAGRLHSGGYKNSQSPVRNEERRQGLQRR